MKIVAVTACPMGTACTYMAAEALERVAQKENIDIKVETQGAMGIENEITHEDIKSATVAILTKDVDIKNKERFKDKKIVEVSIMDVIKNPDSIIKMIKEELNLKKPITNS